MWTGGGERLWRPLNNPPRIMVSAFSDNNPRGFGLCQRDRVFDHYLDGVNLRSPPDAVGGADAGPDGAGWGKGSIQLCEIPTDDEIHDNVVAMWVPEDAHPGRRRAEAELSPALGRRRALSDQARRAASPHGWGAAASPVCRVPRACASFVVEFLGGPLTTLPYGVKPDIVVTASRGSLRRLSNRRSRLRRRARPLARRIRPHGRCGARPGRIALLSAGQAARR